MKKIGTILLLLLAVGFSAQANIDESISISMKKYRADTPARPHMPAADALECYYEDGQVWIHFYDSEGTATVEINNVRLGYATLNIIDTSIEECVDVIYPGMFMTIVITTSEGNVYEGEFEIPPIY